MLHLLSFLFHVRCSFVFLPALEPTNELAFMDSLPSSCSHFCSTLALPTCRGPSNHPWGPGSLLLSTDHVEHREAQQSSTCSDAAENVLHQLGSTKVRRVPGNYSPPLVASSLRDNEAHEHNGRFKNHTGKATSREQLWYEFFSDPSYWSDNRFHKINPKHPDFKHKRTKEALWVESLLNPPWVKAELAALAHGHEQSHDVSIFNVDNRIPSWKYNRCTVPCGTALDVRTFCKEGRLKEAMHILDVMDEQVIKGNSGIYVCLLQSCIKLKALMEGKRVHAHIIKSGFKPNVFLLNTLVHMYSKCGSVVDAYQVFSQMTERNMVTWTIMIAAFSQHGDAKEALKLFWQMLEEGVKPDHVTFASILKACTSLTALEQGKRVHAHIISSGYESDVFVGNNLIDMYCKCGSIEYAERVFEKMPMRDVISWNVMITGYAQHHGHAEDAFKLFWKMEQEGVEPDKVTFLNILKACTSSTTLEQGRLIHAHIIKGGFQSDVFIGSTLVDMYAKCGSIEDARAVFDSIPVRNVVSWNAMVAGYIQHGQAETVLQLFQQMESEGITPDQFTFVYVLKACISLRALEYGKQIHTLINDCGCELDLFVGSTLVDMYAKCGSIMCARQVFDKMLIRDVVAWTAMITGYSEHSHADEALELFWQMEREGVKPDEVTFISVLKACATLAVLEHGKRIHASIIKFGIELSVSVGNTLIDMYGKCGSIEHARKVFDNMCNRDVVSWNTIIAGYAQHGHAEEVLQLFQKMQQEVITLDHVTFVCVLSACSHAGLVDEGYDYFHFMIQDCAITPEVEHYVSMVDLLSRAGHLEEAEDFIKRMPFQPSAVVWVALLGSCRVYGNVELAKWVTECIFELEPHNDAAFVLLANIYAAAGRWDDKMKMRENNAACSWLGFNHIEG